ncbi:hypothetical protein VNO77_02547 [Canavalia gladiata]|uniref:Uncharacterized protein n=1 Tax=Canavalia gladiata TaxID=3824 RepID=A0AAN9R612_CANGL
MDFHCGQNLPYLNTDHGPEASHCRFQGPNCHDCEYQREVESSSSMLSKTILKECRGGVKGTLVVSEVANLRI